jgi:hypothetical protein
MPKRLPGFLAEAALGSPSTAYRTLKPFYGAGTRSPENVRAQFAGGHPILVMREDGALCLCYEDDSRQQSVCDCEAP